VPEDHMVGRVSRSVERHQRLAAGEQPIEVCKRFPPDRVLPVFVGPRELATPRGGVRLEQHRRARGMIGVSVRHKNVIEPRASVTEMLPDRRQVARIADAGVDERALSVRSNEQVGVVPVPCHRAGVERLESDRVEHGQGDMRNAKCRNTPTLTQDTFTTDETRALAPYFTNTDKPVFALINLPETVKGALFARYSRSAKSLRRLFLDEFLGEVPRAAADASDRTEAGTPLEGSGASGVGTERADRLFARVLNEYGDDSVAQLGGAHLACEGVSNVLTKALEWGRLMSYLEQSTRYVPYTDRPNGRWKYHVPAEIVRIGLAADFGRTLDRAFETYARWLPAMESHFRTRYPRAPGAPPSEPRLWTRFAGSCPRRPRRTSGCSERARRSRRSCSGCSPIRWKKCGPMRS
jgi:thymidylate synthase ThyX